MSANKDIALVIMAAGIGSRFGQGIKQLAKVGPGEEIIMDYSIYDAKAAGFTKVVFIIRKDIEEVFREVIGDRIAKVLPVSYVFQEMSDLPAGFSVPEGRKKPWGTGQAVLCAKPVVDCPFAVINADDYYGKEAFVKMAAFLKEAKDGVVPAQYAMAGFILGNTLSDNGAVTRGVCSVKDGKLAEVIETGGLVRKDADTVKGERDGGEIEVPASSYVSMNFWGFTASIFEELSERFVTFLSSLDEKSSLKGEYLLPTIVDAMMKEGKACVAVLPTNDKWFGVTYAEDKQTVIDSLAELHAAGVYPPTLY